MEGTAEEKIRQEAIGLRQSGLEVSAICRHLQRSRPWFYKWWKRYASGKPDWFRERSRRPHQIANKTPLETEDTVVRIRRGLERSKYSPIGALTIQWRMEKRNLPVLPTWTIDRILKRRGLVRGRKKVRPSSGRPYPDVRCLFSDSIQQADLVGPRYIQNDGRFFSFNVIDLESYLAAINPARSKRDQDIGQSLLRSWKTIGKPDFVQMDNELSFRGSNRHPRSLGLVLRMCLALGVQVIFIPPGEPWRNGAVEKFQDIFDRSFYRRQRFSNYRHLKKEARSFERFRNRHHRCSAIGGKTPHEYVRCNDISICKLDAKTSLKQIDLSLADGYIHLIRFIRSNRLLDIFGEKFKLPKSVCYEYVIATICTRIHALQVRVGQQPVCTFDYPMPIQYRRSLQTDV